MDMPIVDATEMLKKATQEGYAIGAFNITNLIQMEAVFEAHLEKRAPLIIQTSVTPSKFLGQEVIVAIYHALAKSAPIPVALHLDHCNDIDYCKKCADLGWTSIMIDASREPFEENIRQTKEVVEYCHTIGNISVEGELGTVSGVEDQVKVAMDEAQLCDPKQALEFLEQTGVDLVAPAIGTAHGVYKTKKPKVDFERFGEIAQLVNGEKIRAPLVVHGGTGLPQDYVEKLIELGGAKFNVSTDLKRSLIDATYTYISNHREEYNPGKLDSFVKDAVQTKVIEWIDMLGSAGKA
jgi:tagatose 1,6-diphosphate aldolase GatY/KbaY